MRGSGSGGARWREEGGPMGHATCTRSWLAKQRVPSDRRAFARLEPRAMATIPAWFDDCGSGSGGGGAAAAATSSGNCRVADANAMPQNKAGHAK